MTHLKVTQHMREKAHGPDAPKFAAMGLDMVEELVTKLIEGDPVGAFMLANDICKRPTVADAVIAMAVGTLAQVEITLRESAQTISDMLDADPETLDKIKERIAAQYGIPVEDVQVQ